MADSLELVDPSLSDRLAGISDTELHRVMHSVASMAVDQVGLADEEVIRAALGSLVTGATIPPAGLQNLVDTLDNKAFDLSDRAEAGTRTEREYKEAFAKARAATAVLQAFESDVRRAVGDVIYEAFYAVNQDQLLIRSAVEAAM